MDEIAQARIAELEAKLAAAGAAKWVADPVFETIVRVCSENFHALHDRLVAFENQIRAMDTLGREMPAEAVRHQITAIAMAMDAVGEFDSRPFDEGIDHLRRHLRDPAGLRFKRGAITAPENATLTDILEPGEHWEDANLDDVAEAIQTERQYAPPVVEGFPTIAQACKPRRRTTDAS